MPKEPSSRHLTNNMLGKNFSRRHFKIYFFFFFFLPENRFFKCFMQIVSLPGMPKPFQEKIRKNIIFYLSQEIGFDIPGRLSP